MELNYTQSINASVFPPANASLLPQPPDVAQAAVYFVQALCLFLGPSVCLVAFARTPALRTPFNLYLITILLGEFSQSFYALFTAIQHHYGHWVYSKQLCTFSLFTYFYAGGVVGTAHFLVSANRFWALFLPYHFRRHNTERLTLVMCASVWMSTAALILPWVIINKQFLDENRPLYSCRMRMSSQPTYSRIIVAMFVVPTAFMIFNYPFLLRKHLAQQRVRNNMRNKTMLAVSTVGGIVGPSVDDKGDKPERIITDPTESKSGERSKQVVQQPQQEKERMKQKQHSNAFFVLTSIVVFALVFWTPLILYSLGDVVAPHSPVYQSNDATYSALVSWLICSSCLDPLVFIYTVPLLRKQIKHFCLVCLKEQRAGLGLL